MKTLKKNKVIATSDAKSIGKKSKTKIEPTEFRNACGAFATGVTVITSKTDGNLQGMTANGFMSVSLNPPLIVISVGNDRTIHKTISESGYYGVSILGESQIEVSNHFAGKLNPNLNIQYNDIEKTPYLKNNIAYFLAKVKSSHIEGDHTLFVGEVEQFGVTNQEDPILFNKGQYKTITK